MIRRLISPRTGKVTYQVDVYGPDGERVRKTFKKAREAKIYESQAEVAKQTETWGEIMAPPARVTFAELVGRYAQAHHQQKSWASFKAMILPILLEHFGPKKLKDITYLDLELYRQERRGGLSARGTPRSPARVNRELAVLKHLLNKAVAWGLLSANPFKAGESLALKEPQGRLRYLTHEEIPRLLAACPAHLAPLVKLALHTGLRRTELFTLRWEQIVNGVLYLDGDVTKNSEPRAVPLNAEALAALEAQRRRGQLTSVYVFPSPSGGPYKDIKDPFKGALRRAGIKNFRFHDLRHTFASHLAMAGVPLQTIAQLLGHKSLTMTLRYAHLSPGHLQEAVEKLVIKKVRNWSEIAAPDKKGRLP